MNYFNFVADSNYPVNSLALPEERYPEYPWRDFKGNERNDVYRMVRDIFINIGLDKENIGKSNWNPLGDYIDSGNTVLIKPNLVKHINLAETDMKRGMECLITHPSITRCVFDYVCIALKGKGKIIIADAPIQDCNFDEMLNNSGYGELFEYIKSLETEALKIEIGDLRGTRRIREEKYRRQVDREDLQWPGCIVDIKDNSNFTNVIKKSKLRITNYHGRDTVAHHKDDKNEYCISEAALRADVIINLVKPKTHRIAGYTAALKNMIGINTRKEYLPHHRKGKDIPR